MTTKNHSNYLKFLAQGYNTLLVSSNHYNEYDEVEEFFDSSIQRSMSDEELENFTLTIMSNYIDIVILDFTTNEELALKFYEKIKVYESRIVVIAILPHASKESMWKLIDKFDGALFEGFDSYQLKDKLFTQLSLFYTIKSVGRRDVKIDSGSSEMGMSLEEFFDMYEGSSLFIVDELMALNKSLKSGDLNPQLIEKISQKLLEISDTFSKNSEVSDIAHIFKDLSEYLIGLDFSTIKPESLYAFDYICAIIDDTNAYIMDMFVDRVFKDTYIVKHSLENNIKFMKDALASKEGDDESELEFF